MRNPRGSDIYAMVHTVPKELFYEGVNFGNAGTSFVDNVIN
jgi:hypothetical protein